MITFTTVFRCDVCPRQETKEATQKGIKQQGPWPATCFIPSGWRLGELRPKLICDTCVREWFKAKKEVDDMYLGKLGGENG